MSNFLPIPPELNGSIGNLKLRSNQDENSIPVRLKDYLTWHSNTDQVQISENVIHFTQPDGAIVGIKVLSNNGTQSGSNQQ